jgi:hypothetical protein
VDVNTKNTFIAIQEISEITSPFYFFPEKSTDCFTLSRVLNLNKDGDYTPSQAPLQTLALSKCSILTKKLIT